MAKDPKKNEKKEQKNNFLKEVRTELKKVTWPSRKDLVTSTGTVLLITIIIAAIVFVLDFAFEKANTYGVDKLKSVVSSSVSEEVDSNNDVEVTTEENTEATTDDTSATTEENAETSEATTETENTAETPVEENAQTEEAAQ